MPFNVVSSLRSHLIEVHDDGSRAGLQGIGPPREDAALRDAAVKLEQALA